MNKSLIYSTITGTIVYFLLGWLFYGILFTDLYPANEEHSMLFVFFGCLFYVLGIGVNRMGEKNNLKLKYR